MIMRRFSEKGDVEYARAMVEKVNFYCLKGPLCVNGGQVAESVECRTLEV